MGTSMARRAPGAGVLRRCDGADARRLRWRQTQSHQRVGGGFGDGGDVDRWGPQGDAVGRYAQVAIQVPEFKASSPVMSVSPRLVSVNSKSRELAVWRSSSTSALLRGGASIVHQLSEDAVDLISDQPFETC